MHTVIPSIATCLSLMDEYGMLDNIRRHSFAVARLSEMLLKELQQGVSDATHLPDKDLVVSGALLHDIAKTPCLNERCNHAKQGAVLCRRLGYTEICEIVGEHVVLTNFEPKRYAKGIFHAKEIVFYADKRVLHDTVVSLATRLDYIIERYGNNDPYRIKLIRKNFNCCLELERALFAFLSSSPEDFNNRDYSAPYLAR